MRRARLSRREQASCDLEAHALKLLGDLGKAQREVPLDVLEEDELGLDLADDPGDLGPEVPGIVPPPPVAGDGEGLAGIAGKDEMNAAAPRAAVEGSKVAPDSSLRQAAVSHARREGRRGVGLPLDVAD